METSPIVVGFGLLVTGADLKGVALPQTVEQLRRALDDHLLVVLRDANLSQEEYVAFGHCLGNLEDFSIVEGTYSLPLSNMAEDGTILPADDPFRRNIAADALWHTDHTYREKRARYSILMAEIVPKRGGETQYADTRAAYEALPRATKDKLDGLVAVHSIIYSRALAGFTDWPDEMRAKLRPIPQPLVFENPHTGRKSLYLASHIAEIVGMPTKEARELVAELIGFATQPQFVYSHRWCSGDIVIWDDRATMHRRAPYDDLQEPRKLYTMRVIEDSELFDPGIEYEIH